MEWTVTFWENIFSSLDQDESAIWSLLLASGYLRAETYQWNEEIEDYALKLTNKEVRLMFRNMIGSWFEQDATAYNDFIKALLEGNIDEMGH